MSERLYCPIKNSECSIKTDLSGGPLCFIAIPFREEMLDTRRTVTKILKKHGIQPYLADEDVTTGRDILCKICEKITFSDFGIIELTSVNPNVMLEFGIILGRRKPVFILFNKGTKADATFIPADIVALDRIEYTNQQTLSRKFERGIEQYFERLDRKKKQLKTMMQLARGTSRDKDFGTTSKLLDIVFESMEIEKGGDGSFVNLLKEIVSDIDDPDLYMHYSLALAKTYAWQKNVTQSVSYAKSAVSKGASKLKRMFKNADKIIDEKTVQKILKNQKKFFRDPFVVIADNIKRPMAIDDLFVYMWHIVHKLEKPEVVISYCQRMLKLDLSKKTLPYYLGRRLWEMNRVSFEFMSFLNAFAEMYPHKESEAAKLAIRTVNSLDNILSKYYRSF